MNKCDRFRDPLRGTARSAAVGAGTRARFNKHVPRFCLALALSATALFAPSSTNAQACKGNTNVGCVNPGAVCSPVTKGLGSSGHCATPAGLPPGERECECAGTPAAIAQMKDFDVVTTFLDVNQFPLNPKWGQQVRDNTLPSPKASCPVDNTNTQDWIASPNCTSYPVTFNGASGFPCGHHINFLAITYEGTAAWNGGPTHLYPFGDQDYTFNVTRDDAALYSTAGPHVHTEFDATETVNNWDGTGTWWERFHHDGVEKGDAQAGQMIDGHHVIVVGLLGMDSYHGGKTELHPAYGMFVLVSQDPRRGQSSWAFFVRNWGNEGYCGGDQENMVAQPIRIQIPHVPLMFNIAGRPTKTATVSSNIWEGARNTDDLSGMTIGAQRNEGGMLLTFGLLTPDKQSWFMGDVTFQETVVEPTVTNEPEEGFPPAFEAARAQIDKLPKSVQKDLLAQQQSVGPIKRGKPVSPATLAEPTQLGNSSLSPIGKVVGASDLVRPSKDSVGELNRSKRLEILNKKLRRTTSASPEVTKRIPDEYFQ